MWRARFGWNAISFAVDQLRAARFKERSSKFIEHQLVLDGAFDRPYQNFCLSNALLEP